HSAIISDAQPVQAELRRSKVIEAGLEIRDVTANQIQLDFVKRAGAGRGAKINLATRILSLPSDAGGEIEQLSHGPQVGYRHCVGGNALGDRRQSGDSGGAYLAGQTQPLQRGINFERRWLVSPVQEMWVRANAEVGMFRSFVVGPRCLRIAVVSHGKGERLTFFKNARWFPLRPSRPQIEAEPPRILACPTNAHK